MAEIAKAGWPSISSLSPSPDRFPTYTAGETIAAGDCCYINPADGLAYRCLATGAGAAAARCRGQAAQLAQAGEAVTLTQGMRFNYGAALAPGADYYLSAAVPGGVADAAGYPGAPPVGFAADSSRIQFFHLN